MRVGDFRRTTYKNNLQFFLLGLPMREREREKGVSMCMSSPPHLHRAPPIKTVATILLTPTHVCQPPRSSNRELKTCDSVADTQIDQQCKNETIFNDVSASQHQQATSDYLSLALYARANAAVVPAALHSSQSAILRVEVSVEFPAASSRVQRRCRPSRGSRSACDAVVALRDGV